MILDKCPPVYLTITLIMWAGLAGGCALSEPSSEHLMMRTAPVDRDETPPGPPGSVRLADVIDTITFANSYYLITEAYERRLVERFVDDPSREGAPTEVNPLGLWSMAPGVSVDLSDRFALGLGGIGGDINATLRVAGPYFVTGLHAPAFTRNSEIIVQRRLLHPRVHNGWGVGLGAYWRQTQQRLGEYLVSEGTSFKQRSAGGRLYVRTPALDKMTSADERVVSTAHIAFITRIGVETEFNTTFVSVGARLTLHTP